MTDLSLTNELLANIDRQIAEEEAQVRERIHRLCRHDDHDSRLRTRDEWHQFNLRIKPLRNERDHIVKQLAAIEACKPLVMVVPQGSMLLE